MEKNGVIAYFDDSRNKYNFYDMFTTGVLGATIIADASGDLSQGDWGKADFVIKKSAKVDSGLRLALVFQKKWKKYFIICKGTEVDFNLQTVSAISACPNYPKALEMVKKWQRTYEIELIVAHS